MTREELDSKKKMIIDFMSSKSYKSMSLKEMGAVLQVPSKQKKEFRKVIEELSEEGKVQFDLKGKIKLMPEHIKTGKFMGTQKGFGFVRVEGEDEDIFISSHKTRGAIDGDTVQVALDRNQRGKRREGAIMTILERGVDILVGTYSKSKSFGFVVPDNQKFGKDIYIAKADSKGAITGHKVVVEITDYGNSSRNPEGRIIEIIGHVNDPGVDILSVIKAYGLPEEYPDEVMAQAESIGDEVKEEEKAGRTDLRGLMTVTIDGEDAKDLDDAITLTKEGDIYHLGVHIADVSNYVTEKSPLDKEALKRGTSVYLVDRVIPMLPHRLSNGICSLNAGTDRLALSCLMDINSSGEIIDHNIEETVINVDRRMSYTSINKIVELKDEEEREEYREFIPMFELMYELAGILREKRFKKGSLDFDFPESKIVLDEKGKPIDITEYERNNAHRIIEEFMLAANRTVAEEYYWRELPFVYRVHDEPDSEKILQLGIFVNNFGYTIKSGANDEIHPKEIQKLISNIKGKPEEALISRLALRSMKQAKYSVGCDGHFGLAMKYYCHFTSPIRRYPDLQIHRIIKDCIHGRLSEGRIAHYNKILPEVAAASSQLERRADDSEREVDKMKKAEYMEKFIGQSFDGVISGVTTWGMYVELPNTVEGMIRVANIPGDYFYFDEEHYCMTGEHTGRLYKLGESIRITVEAVDRLTKTVDFVIAEAEENESVKSEMDGKESEIKTDKFGVYDKSADDIGEYKRRGSSTAKPGEYKRRGKGTTKAGEYKRREKGTTKAGEYKRREKNATKLGECNRRGKCVSDTEELKSKDIAIARAKEFKRKRKEAFDTEEFNRNDNAVRAEEYKRNDTSVIEEFKEKEKDIYSNELQRKSKKNSPKKSLKDKKQRRLRKSSKKLDKRTVERARKAENAKELKHLAQITFLKKVAAKKASENAVPHAEASAKKHGRTAVPRNKNSLRAKTVRKNVKCIKTNSVKRGGRINKRK